MSKPGVVEYKCRRCGIIYSDSHSPDILMTLNMGINGTTHFRTEAVSRCAGAGLIEIHQCPPAWGGVGVADMIGGRWS